MKKNFIRFVFIFLVAQCSLAKSERLLKPWYNHPAGQCVESCGERPFGCYDIWRSMQRKNPDQQKHSLESNCRIRSYSPLKIEGGATFVQAEGENRNPSYQVPLIKESIFSQKGKLQTFELKVTILNDVQSEPGQEYTFILKYNFRTL